MKNHPWTIWLAILAIWLFVFVVWLKALMRYGKNYRKYEQACREYQEANGKPSEELRLIQERLRNFNERHAMMFRCLRRLELGIRQYGNPKKLYWVLFRPEKLLEETHKEYARKAP